MTRSMIIEYALSVMLVVILVRSPPPVSVIVIVIKRCDRCPDRGAVLVAW